MADPPSRQGAPRGAASGKRKADSGLPAQTPAAGLKSRTVATMPVGQALEVVKSAIHEVRNPLSVVATAAHLLQGPEGPDRDRAMKALLGALQQARSVLDNLADVVFLHDEGMPPRAARVSVSEWLAKAVSAVNGTAVRRQTTMTAVAAQPGLHVRGDAYWLGRALSALLSVAVRVSPEGSHIEVAANAAGGLVEICIHEANEPPPQDSPFARLCQREGERRRHGTHLALSRFLVEQHGGALGFHGGDAASAPCMAIVLTQA